MKTCPCALAVRLNYRGYDQTQVRIVRRLIRDMGEWTAVYVNGQGYRVSRHCIALHGIVAAQIADYGFEKIPVRPN
jgi:hypothetical protein